jgi:hypothetical protein
MLERRNLTQEVNGNQAKLDDCDHPHNFEPVRLEDGSASFYRCSRCGGLVDAFSGLRYTLSGSFE